MRLTLTYLFLLAGLFTSGQLSAQDCEHPDFAALMAFYESTNGADWTDNTGWADGAAGTNCDPCSGWKGVRCLNSGRVRQIELPANNLSGNIPEEISELDHLSFLAVNFNSIYGELPETIGNLIGLRSLNVSVNNISGAIPESFYLLTGLLYVNMAENNINGEISEDFSNLVQLRFLSLSANQLSGIIPNALLQLTNLSLLSLSGNHLTGSIPLNIGLMQGLTSLYLGENNLHGEIPNSITELTRLKTLVLSSNDLSGSIPTNIGNLSNLERLLISYNNISGPIPASVGNLSSINFISATSNQLQGNLPESIGQLSTLQAIYAENNNFNGSIPESVGQLPNLRQLRVQNNDFEGALPDFSSPFIEFIGFGGNSFSGTIPDSYATQQNLFGISLEDNNLSGAVPEGFGDIQSLTYISLEKNNLSGCIPEDLAAKCNNATVRLNFNRLLPWGGNFSQFCSSPISQTGAPCNDGIPNNGEDVINEDCSCGDYVPPCEHPDVPALEELYNATNGTSWFPATNWLLDCAPCGWDGIDCDQYGRVISIDLPSRHLSGELPENLNGLPFLKRLRITNNNVGGTLSPELFTLPALKVIDLGKNAFTGEIPTNAGDLPTLLNLLLYNNAFTGNLPASIGTSNIVRFHAFGNNLSGCIPDSYLNKCGDDFDFSENPRLPWQGDFQNFCNKIDQIGAHCNDGNPLTEADRIDDDCNCSGTGPYGEEECPESIGKPCDDNNQLTYDDVVQKDCSCEGTDRVIILEDIYIGLTISPNPADDEFTLTTSELATEILVFSSDGVVQKKITPTGQRIKIDISDLSPGLYLVSVTGKNAHWAEKLIVR
jgi:Leucine-rich repeat (LRR) protein